MKRNVGGLDRAIRIILGLALIIAAATGAIGWWGWLGILPLATGVFSFCGLYSLLGVSTCARK
ncbi:DUF2892 domain-containing protein [Neisseria sp.]|uniref:YgaP family membrane protein n=1 Tax=Neisseria sp. TaxID=192066 RepID=UPI0035A06B21